MIFYFNSNGEPLGSIIGRVFSGSVNATDTYFVCPVSSDLLVSVAYSLANGESTHKIPMQSLGADNVNIKLDDNTVYNVWKVETPYSVTEKSGEIVVQFFIANADGSVVSTARSIFTVEEGVELKELDNDANYDEISTVISGLNLYVEKAKATIDSAFIADSSVIRNENQIVVGKYNYKNSSATFIAGCGESETIRRNGFYITNTGYARTDMTPLDNSDLTNRLYVDTKIISVCGSKEASTQVDNVVLTNIINKQLYYVNNVNNLTLVPVDGNKEGDYFYIMFMSGSVPTAFAKPQVGNMIIEEIVPKSNHVVEISGVWNGSKWIVLSHQTAV